MIATSKINKKRFDFFNGKLVLITGGGSGLGLYLAQLICRHQGKVIITGRTLEKLEAAKQQVLSACADACIEFYQVDVSDAHQVEELFATVFASHGAIDGVIINAGQVHIDDFRFIPMGTIAKLLNTNINGAVYTAKAGLQYLSESGSFLTFTSSIVGYATATESTIYSASKAAVISFSRILRLELAPRGVHVLTFSPGFFETDFAMGGTATPTMMKIEKVANKYLDAIIDGKEEVIFPLRLALLVFVVKLIAFSGLGTWPNKLATRRLHEYYGNGKLSIKKSKEIHVRDSFGFRRLIMIVSPTKKVADWIHDKLKIKRIRKGDTKSAKL